jgi:beta-lactamase class A
MSTISWARILIGISTLVLLANVLWAWRNTAKERESARYPLLAKRLFVEQPTDVLINFAPLRDALKLYFSKLDAPFSFYFEYLPTGTSIQIGERTELVGASLLKVPLVMDLYKAVELGKTILDKEVMIAEKDIDKAYGSLWKQGVGTKLTLKEAVRLTLVESDNTAFQLLRNEVIAMPDHENTSFKELDIPTDKNDESRWVISAKSYSSILKCLYLSCFLRLNDSQEILDLLARSSDQRIRGGVPQGVKVANKIGTFSTEVQSDCGVVYAPQRPYLVCILLSMPADQADPHIQTISKLIYEYVSDPNR